MSPGTIHDQRERAGVLQGDGLAEHLVGVAAPALHAVTAELVLALRCETDVRHHRDAGIGEQPHLRQHRQPALELHRVRARLLHEAHRGGERLLGGGLVRAEGQVSDHQRTADRAGDGTYERDQLVDCHRQRRLVSVDIVAGGVTDEQHRDPGLVEGRGRVLVVGGEHRPALAPGLHVVQVMGADAPDGAGRGRWLREAGTVRGWLLGLDRDIGHA